MPDILIKNLFDQVVPFRANHNSVLNAIHSEFIDWMHTCGAKGRCTTCKMKVLEGIENISELSENEQRYRNKGRLGIDERLACQCQISGNISIEVSSENKLPHMNYSY